MATSVDYLYKYVKRLIRKNQEGGLGSIDFQLMWNGESRSYMDDLLGRWESRSNGKTGMNTGLIEDETILQKLSPFINLGVLDILSGVANKPDDFIYRLAMRINNKDVYKINHNQIATVNDNVIDPPAVTTDTYYFVEYNGYYSFLPDTVTEAELDYIKTPDNIVWGYTFDSIGRQVYNKGLSVQPQWDNSSCIEITKRMLKSLGVSFKDADFANFGQSVITTGN